jgi:hypothetical protein
VSGLTLTFPKQSRRPLRRRDHVDGGLRSAPYRHARETRRLIGSYPGPGFALLHGPDILGEGPHSNLAVQRAVGIAFDRATSCRPVPNNLGVVVELCRWR